MTNGPKHANHGPWSFNYPHISKRKIKKKKEEEFVRTHGGNVVALLSNFVYWNLINQILPPKPFTPTTVCNPSAFLKIFRYYLAIQIIKQFSVLSVLVDKPQLHHKIIHDLFELLTLIFAKKRLYFNSGGLWHQFLQAVLWPQLRFLNLTELFIYFLLFIIII